MLIQMISANLGLVRAALLLGLRTVAPTVLFYFGASYFFEEGGKAIVLWLFMLGAWVLVWIAAEHIRGKIRKDWEMQLRQVIASVRRLTNHVAGRMLAAHREGHVGGAALFAAYDHDTLMRMIVRAVFLIASRNNRDLDNHIRVTFMEVADDALRIRYYTNTEDAMPATMSAGESFSRGDGVAGHAWERNEMILIPDVPAHLKAGGTMFSIKTEAHRKPSVKSIVSIPLELPDAAGSQTKVIGVLNLDSLEAGYFGDSFSERREIEITIRPYLRLMTLLYTARYVSSPQPSAVR